jgi:hypothetical protein
LRVATIITEDLPMFSRHCLSVGSSSYSSALFNVPVDVARSLVPQDDFFTVAEILPGEAIFFVGTGEFRKADLGPYKEMYVGFYTENREKPGARTREENFEEFTKQESKMYLWKNWVNTAPALDKSETSFAMRHDEEGSIELSVPRQSDHAQSAFSMQRTHYGRLNDVPHRVRLDLEIEQMATSPGQGTLVLEGPIAEACAQLGVPKQPLVSLWIEEMNFKIGTPLQLLPGEAPA